MSAGPAALPPGIDGSFAAYEGDAVRTGPAGPITSLTLAVLALGVAGEAGEVADLVKKHVGHGHDLPTEKLVDELGDVLWYLTVLANALGVSLEAVAARNVAKLRRRYPDGFSSEASLARVDVAKGDAP